MIAFDLYVLLHSKYAWFLNLNAGLQLLVLVYLLVGIENTLLSLLLQSSFT